MMEVRVCHRSTSLPQPTNQLTWSTCRLYNVGRGVVDGGVPISTTQPGSRFRKSFFRQMMLYVVCCTFTLPKVTMPRRSSH